MYSLPNYQQCKNEIYELPVRMCDDVNNIYSMYLIINGYQINEMLKEWELLKMF